MINNINKTSFGSVEVNSTGIRYNSAIQDKTVYYSGLYGGVVKTQDEDTFLGGNKPPSDYIGTKMALLDGLYKAYTQLQGSDNEYDQKAAKTAQKCLETVLKPITMVKTVYGRDSES